MSRFLDVLVVSPLADGYTWYLDHPFRYLTDIGATKTIVADGFRRQAVETMDPLPRRPLVRWRGVARERLAPCQGSHADAPGRSAPRRSDTSELEALDRPAAAALGMSVSRKRGDP